MSSRFRRLCLFLVLLALPLLARAQVTLVLSDSSPAYQEVAAGFHAAFAGKAPVQVFTLGNLSTDALQQLTSAQGLIVPVGLKAMQVVADRHAGNASVLALLVPRAAFSSLDWPRGLQQQRKLSAVYLDQPVPRLLALVEAALPAAKRVGVVLSQENQGLVTELRAQAARRELTLNLEMIRSGDDVPAALRQILPGSDVLLLLPDTVVVNAASVQNVLLTTYRYRIPVVGFSQGLVRAGAAVAVYTNLAQMGRMGGALARQWNPASGALPPPQYPEAYALASNTQVTRSLLIGLAEESEMLRRIEAKQ